MGTAVARSAAILLWCACFFQTVKCERITLKYTITEEAEANTVIGNIRDAAKLDQRYGPESLPDISFSILKKKGNTAYENFFAITPENGVLRTIKQLDREQICEAKTVDCAVEFDVVVKPVPIHYLEIIGVVISINDLNDNEPAFPKESISISVSESVMPGVSFILPPAVDRDSGNYGIQGYNLIEDTDTFGLSVTNTIDGTPDLRLTLLEPLDREQIREYNMQVIARDGGDPPRFGSLRVHIEVSDANDNSPVFANVSYEVSVPENAPVGSVVLRVYASDLDQDMNGLVVYNISPESFGTARGVLNINNHTGEIYIERPLDYETQHVYRLLVTATDRGPDSVPSATRVVIHVEDVNDHKPAVMVNSMTSSGRVELSENTKGGHFVAHISVEDLDSGANGETQCDLGDHRFTLNKVYPNEYTMTTGNVTFDREYSPTFTVPLLCVDGGNPPLQTNVQITGTIMDINDNPPMFTKRVYSDSIQENNALNDVILSVNATDPDAGANANVTYAIRADSDRMVKINPRTGVIRARGVFDYERQHSYTFQVVAYDHGDPVRSSSATVVLHLIDINDEPPLFYRNVYNFAITEHQPRGSIVGSVDAIDSDASPYNDVVFSIVHNARKRDPFEIGPRNGKIVTSIELDREKTAFYTLVVAAYNPGHSHLSSTATVHVRVLDLNDNAPVVHFPASSNNSINLECIYASRDPVIRVDARDPDEGANGRLTFSLVRDSGQGVFHVDANTGAISVTRGARHVELATYKLIVRVADQGDPRKNSLIPFTVHVNNTGPCPPDATLQMSSVQITANRNRIILISLGGVTLILVLVLLSAIFALKRKDHRRDRKEYRYACPVRFRQKKNVKHSDTNCTEPAERVGSLYSFNTEDDCKEKEVHIQMPNDICENHKEANSTHISAPWRKDGETLKDKDDGVGNIEPNQQLRKKTGAASSPLEQHYSAGTYDDEVTSSADDNGRGVRANGLDPGEANRHLRAHILASGRDPNTMGERQWMLAKEAVEHMLHSVRRQQAGADVDAASAHSGDGDSGRGASDEGENNKTSPRAKPNPEQDYLYDPRRANALGRDEVEKCSICSDPPDEIPTTFIKPLDYPDVAREAIPMATLHYRDGSQTLPRNPHAAPKWANPKYSSNDSLHRSPDLGNRPTLGPANKLKDETKMRLIESRNHKKVPVSFRTFAGANGSLAADGRHSPARSDPRDPRAAGGDNRGYNLYAY